ncbi:MAG: DUF459 domain-containing protein [Actinomycetota bacterium]|nr:DUF459 domain-containing protein [Actinomycetota bacterium]
MTARSTPAWGLRVTLILVWASLIAAALIVQGTQLSAKPVTQVPHKLCANSHTCDPSTTVPTTTTIPGAVTGEITRTRVGGGCGLSLGGQVTPAPVGSCTVLEIGDSLGNDLGWGLLRQVPTGSSLHLIQLDKSDTGLAKPSFFDWPSHLALDLREYKPQLVLICLGGNDQQGLVVNDSAVQFPSSAWETAYAVRVRQLVAIAVSSGAYVLWVGLPIMQQSSYSQGTQILNSIYQAVINTEPDATFVPTWSLFSNPQGQFQANAMVNRNQEALRQPDGVHLTYMGENVEATYILREMALIYHVQLAPKDPLVVTGWD